MAYRYRYRKKRRFYKKRTYKRSGNKYINYGLKALKIAQYLKSVLNVEFKEHNVQATAEALPTTGIITQLTNIAQGDTKSTRDGDQVKLTQIYVNGIIQKHASATATSVRILLVMDKQTNGAIYTLADLLEDTSASDNIVSANNLDNKFRFKVLYDKVFNVSNSGESRRKYKIFKKLPIKIRYDGNAGDITDITSWSLSLVAIADEATNTPGHTFFARLRFVDN